MAEDKKVKRKSKKLTQEERDLILIRRERVNSLHNRGLSLREIQATMANPTNSAYLLNPKTGKPFTLNAIQRDVVYLRTQNLKALGDSADIHRAEMLAELRELRRVGWAGKNATVILKTIQTQMKLLGLDVPEAGNGELLLSGSAGGMTELFKALAKAGETDGQKENGPSDDTTAE